MTGPDQWDGSLVREDKWTTSPKRVVPDGCVFITVKGTGVGTIFPGVAAAIGRDIYAFEPRREFNWRFVETAIRHTVQQLTRTAVGDIPGLSKGPILEHQVTFPPLPEQHRVVEALDSYFSRLDEAEAALERAQRNLKRYRAAVLQAAVEGRLVPTEAALARAEGRDYEPASELLKRILAERRCRWEEGELARLKALDKAPKDDKWKAKYKEPAISETIGLPDLPEGWCWASLDQLAADLEGGTPETASDTASKRWVLRSSAVRQGRVDLTDCATCRTPPRSHVSYARASYSSRG